MSAENNGLTNASQRVIYQNTSESNAHHVTDSVTPIRRAPTRARGGARKANANATTDNSPSSGKWTSRDDEALRRGIATLGAQNQWEQIASTYLNNKFTKSQVIHRYNKLCTPGGVKGSWTIEEDQVIVREVKASGEEPPSWANIAKLLPGRIGKQCRERWVNHLDPELKHTPFSEAEDELLCKLHTELGNKWAIISRHIPGRSDNAVKNRWYSQFASKNNNNGKIKQAKASANSLNSRISQECATLVQDSSEHSESTGSVGSSTSSKGARSQCLVSEQVCPEETKRHSITRRRNMRTQSAGKGSGADPTDASDDSSLRTFSISSGGSFVSSEDTAAATQRTHHSVTTKKQQRKQQHTHVTNDLGQPRRSTRQLRSPRHNISIDEISHPINIADDLYLEEYTNTSKSLKHSTIRRKRPRQSKSRRAPYVSMSDEINEPEEPLAGQYSCSTQSRDPLLDNSHIREPKSDLPVDHSTLYRWQALQQTAEQDLWNSVLLADAKSVSHAAVPKASTISTNSFAKCLNSPENDTSTNLLSKSLQGLSENMCTVNSPVSDTGSCVGIRSPPAQRARRSRTESISSHFAAAEAVAALANAAVFQPSDSAKFNTTYVYKVPQQSTPHTIPANQAIKIDNTIENKKTGHNSTTITTELPGLTNKKRPLYNEYLFQKATTNVNHCYSSLILSLSDQPRLDLVPVPNMKFSDYFGCFMQSQKDVQSISLPESGLHTSVCKSIVA